MPAASGLKPGSVFLVTGGAGGIGAATVALALRHGHKAAVADVDLDAARAVVARVEGDAVALELDVRERASWEHALDAVWERFGGLDVLVSNAGLIYTGWVRDQAPDPAVVDRLARRAAVQGRAHMEAKRRERS